MGWEVVTIKYGHLLETAFKEPGGERLRGWIDSCPNQLYSALTFQGGDAWRKRLLDYLGDPGAVSSLIESRSDDELARLITNLAGNDLTAVREAFHADEPDRSVCVLAHHATGYTQQLPRP